MKVLWDHSWEKLSKHEQVKYIYGGNVGGGKTFLMQQFVESLKWLAGLEDGHPNRNN